MSSVHGILPFLRRKDSNAGLFSGHLTGLLAGRLIFVAAIKMPGDTIHILTQIGQGNPERMVITPDGDTVELPDSFYGTGGYYGWKLQQLEQERREKESQSNVPGYFFPVMILIFLILAMKWNKIERAIGMKPLQKRMPDIPLIADKVKKYDEWLNQYNPYYSSLHEELKRRFLFRTHCFMESKEFRFHSMVEEEYMSVLISGAAVQMTFGLKNYLMDYFPVIHVIRKEYVLNVDKETYYGHVSRNGIYISWNHFLEGYSDYGDSINVGLHEMAHAVSFDVFLGQQDKHDLNFKERLESFIQKGRPVFRAMKGSTSHIFDDYGATNFDEFWAVCIETFFENAEEFQRTMPELYLSVCDLLNQNPLKPGKIINEEMAGLAN